MGNKSSKLMVIDEFDIIKKGREDRAKEDSRYSAFINYGGVVEVWNPASIEAGNRSFIFSLSH